MSILETAFQPDDYWKSFNEDWGDFMYETYFQVEPNTSIAGIEQKLKELHTKNNKHGNAFYHLRPINSMHLYGLDGKSGNAQMVNTFLGVAILLLLIACINYVNLSTARAHAASARSEREKDCRRRQSATLFPVHCRDPDSLPHRYRTGNFAHQATDAALQFHFRKEQRI